MRLPARPQTRRRGNRAVRDLKRRLGIRPKTASWPSPSLRFNPTGFAPSTDTNLVFTRHEQFRCSIGFRLTVQDKNGLVVLCLYWLQTIGKSMVEQSWRGVATTESSDEIASRPSSQRDVATFQRRNAARQAGSGSWCAPVGALSAWSASRTEASQIGLAQKHEAPCSVVAVMPIVMGIML